MIMLYVTVWLAGHKPPLQLSDLYISIPPASWQEAKHPSPSLLPKKKSQFTELGLSYQILQTLVLSSSSFLLPRSCVFIQQKTNDDRHTWTVAREDCITPMKRTVSFLSLPTLIRDSDTFLFIQIDQVCDPTL